MTSRRRHSLGQHFLVDPPLVESMVYLFEEKLKKFSCASWMEIGPGPGALTECLLKMEPLLPFTIVEKDRDLAARCAGRVSAFNQGKVIESDFMDLSSDNWNQKHPMGVISNLPYSAGTAILNRLAEEREKIPFMILMFQKEVALRIRAEASTPDRGSLSMWIQNHWEVKKLHSVPPKSFRPPPKVDSEVLLLESRTHPRIPNTDRHPQAWENLLKTAFAHRRKMLRSGIPSSSPWRKALESSGLDGTKRAESLLWDEWNLLFQAGLPLIASG